MSDKRFNVLMVEGSGDVDIRWVDEATVWRHFCQVKDYLITPRELKDVLMSFMRHAEASQASYARYRLVAKSFGKLVASFLFGLERLRRSTPLIDDRGAAPIVEQTQEDIFRTGAKLKLTRDAIQFVLDRVDFEEFPDMSNPVALKLRFAGGLALAKVQVDCELAYKNALELITNNVGTALTSERIRAAIPLRSLTSTMREGRDPDLDQLRANCDQGSYCNSLAPIPPALNVTAIELTKVPSMERITRQLLETGGPLVVPATIHATFDGSVAFSLTPAAQHSQPAKLLVSCGDHVVSYDYIDLKLRSVGDQFYGDNSHQPNPQIYVKVSGVRNEDARTARLEISYELPPTARRSARLHHKFLMFSVGAMVEKNEILFVNLHTEKTASLAGGTPGEPINVEELEADLEYWRQLVEIEKLLDLTFDLPEVVSSAERRLTRRVYELLVHRTHTDAHTGFAIKVHSEPFKAEDLAQLTNARLLVTGTLQPEVVSLFGTGIRLPQRKLSAAPVVIKNRRALQRALVTKPERFDVILVCPPECSATDLSEDVVPGDTVRLA